MSSQAHDRLVRNLLLVIILLLAVLLAANPGSGPLSGFLQFLAGVTALGVVLFFVRAES